MAISAALVANMFTGFSATVWTWWFLFAVAFGLVVQWGFTVRVPFSLTALSSDHAIVDHILPCSAQLRRYQPLWR
jgi:hypothetical protein